MPSSFSPNLRIELIGAGEQAGTWGSTTNTNLGTLIEDAISGYVSVAVASANQALTALNGAADQSRNAVINLTTSTSAAFAVYAPPEPKQYTIQNASAYTATIFNSTALGNTTAAGTGVAIPAGKTTTVWSDGTNFAFQNTYIAPAIFDALYPIGSIYTNATNSTNPSTLFGFGTWTAFGAGRVPVGFNAADPLFDTAEETGGSKDAIVVSHTHTGTTGGQSADHLHTGNTNSAGTHAHGLSQIKDNNNVLGNNGFFDRSNGGPSGLTTDSAGAHTHGFSTGGVSSDHNHSFTTASAGSSGTNANLQPYITVYMWKRTA